VTRPRVPSAEQLVSGAVTALFVPGDRPDRFGKAAASGADLTIIDLEDAVAPAAKAQALASVLAALSQSPAPLRALVRVNGVGTPTFAGEVTALTELAARPGHGLLGLMVPKCEDAETLARLARALQESVPEPLALVALVEPLAE